MGDGIKFLIDLDSRTHGAAAADTALARVETAAEKANHALKGGHHEFNVLHSDLFKAQTAALLFEKGFEKATEVVAEGFHKVKELIIDTVNEAAGERREKMALSNLLGGEEEAEKTLHYLDRFGDLTEFGEKQTKTWGIELMNAGYKAQEWNDALAGIADVASMSSDKVAGAEAALSSFMRMKETGKLDSRILRGLHLNAKDVIKGLGDALGMSPKAVKKGLEEGTIPAARAYETVLRAIEKKTGKSLGEAGMVAGKGLEAKLTHLRELPEKIIKSVSDSPGIDKIEKAFDRVLEAFDPSGPKGAKMSEGLGRLMDAVGTFIEETHWDKVAASIGGMGASIGKWVDPLSKIAGLMVKVTTGFLKLPEYAEEFGDWIARKLNPQLENTWYTDDSMRKEREQAYARYAAEHPPGFRAVGAAEPAAPVNMSAAAFADLPANWQKQLADFASKNPNAGPINPAPPVEAKAEVVVHVNGAAAGDPKTIGEAAKHGVEAGMTTALEQHALHAGTRSARRKH